MGFIMRLCYIFIFMVFLTDTTRGYFRRQLSLGNDSNSHACAKFPDYCPTECTTISNTGCLVCLCNALTSPTNVTTSSTSSSSSANSTLISENAGITFGFGGTSSSTMSGNNMVGCPKLPNDCDFACLTIDDTGCIKCTCSKTGSSASLSGSLSGGATLTSSGSGTPGSSTVNNLASGSTLTSGGSTSGSGNSHTAGSALTSGGSSAGSTLASNGASVLTNTSSSNVGGTIAQAKQNNNGCPSFPTNCDPTCAALDTHGCPICGCTTGNTLSHGTSSSGTSHQLTSGASANANGCPTFMPSCTQECVTLDGHGCPICLCGKGGKGSIGTSTGNNNGCPSFPTNCRSDCVALNNAGCPLCACTSTSTGSSSNKTSSSTSHVTSSNNNGCPAFPSNCGTDCVELTSLGCPICTCTASGTGGAATGTSNTMTVISSFNNQYNHASPGSMKNNNNCPVYSSSCPAECTSTNDMGCPICSCSHTSSTPHPSIVSSTSSASSHTSPSSTSTSKATSPATVHLSTQAPMLNGGGSSVTTFSPIMPGTGTGTGTITGSSNNNGCAPFDTSCPHGCATLDSKGCLACSCATNSSTNGEGSSGNGNGCPAFDALCTAECTKMDSMGCFNCVCKVPGSGHVTIAPLVSGGGVITTIAPLLPGSGTGQTGGGGNSGNSGNGNGCQTFGTSCAAGCTKLDAMGCLTCVCHSETNITTSGSGTGTATGSGSGCPPFDTSCTPGCASVDAMGCLKCRCHASTNSPLVNPDSGSGSGIPKNCPAVDIMACQPSSCLKLDQNGCIQCNCSDLTTVAPQTTAYPLPVTKAPTTQTPHVTQICPKFDTSCPSGCTVITATGCLDCKCPVTAPPRTTHIQTTLAPNVPTSTTPALTTPISTTSAPTTATQGNTTPLVTTGTQTTTSTPATTTLAPGVCPPTRCVYPCDAGVTLGADNCPVCKCRPDTTTTSRSV